MQILIEVEGITGAGKTTLMPSLEKALKDEGYPVTCIKEPGTTELGKMIRDKLIHSAPNEFNTVTKLLLFLANRADIYSQYKDYKGIILADRGYGSTYVYQILMSNDRKKESYLSILDAVSQEITVTRPATLLLDLTPVTALNRIKRRKELRDRAVSWDANEFMEHNMEVRLNFIKYFKSHYNDSINNILINAEGSKKVTAEKASKELIKELKRVFVLK